LFVEIIKFFKKMLDAFQINEIACIFKIVKSFDRQNAFTMIRRLDSFLERCRRCWANSLSRKRQIEKQRKNRLSERKRSKESETKRQHKRRKRISNLINVSRLCDRTNDVRQSWKRFFKCSFILIIKVSAFFVRFDVMSKFFCFDAQLKCFLDNMIQNYTL
jgi:hypothetical protein